jgi:hypothetical protein
VVERLTRVDQSTINYEFTIIDPTTCSAEWVTGVSLRSVDRRHRLHEQLEGGAERPPTRTGSGIFADADHD